MIKRLYIHNFRCLENFELPIQDHSSVLLIGKNGAGKTAISLALEMLQRISQGTNRVRDLVTPHDFTRGRTDVPIRFEMEVELASEIYQYIIAFELPENFKELRVLEEKLSVSGNPVYSRQAAQVSLAKAGQTKSAEFFLDWHMVALPVVQEQSPQDPLFIFKQWLSRLLILRPIPSLIQGESDQKTLQPNPSVSDFGAWFSGVLAEAPSAYTDVQAYLKQVLPDLKDIKNPVVGPDSRSLMVQFSNEQGSLTLPLKQLSDGEKCFMVCALVLASTKAQENLFCFWDEPDNHLALDEVGHFVFALRQAFQSGGQFIATSHNPEAIRCFSEENTLFLYRRNHLEPTQVRPLSKLQITGDLVNALIRGDVQP